MCQVPFPRGLPKDRSTSLPLVSFIVLICIHDWSCSAESVASSPRQESRAFVGLLVINAKPGFLDWLYHCLVSCSVVSTV